MSDKKSNTTEECQSQNGENELNEAKIKESTSDQRLINAFQRYHNKLDIIQRLGLYFQLTKKTD
jgi:hypothetical protein